MKILLLEDDFELGESVQELLEIEGYLVTHVTNGTKAAEIIYDNKFDLYIFDINVKEMNGMELFEALKNINDKTPTIFISAVIDVKTITKAFELGAIDYLKKPFEPEELLIRIKKELKELNNYNVIEYENLKYDKLKKVLKIDNKIISLGESQGVIFDLLINNIGNVVTLEEFYNELNNFSNTSLKSSINKLKNKININITNIRGVGYLME